MIKEFVGAYEDPRFPEVKKKYGEERAVSIINLWNVYDLYFRDFNPNHPDQVHRACAEIHALWVGANLKRKDKTYLFVHYRELATYVQWYDMQELIRCFRRLGRPIPECFGEYCRQKGWGKEKQIFIDEG